MQLNKKQISKNIPSHPDWSGFCRPLLRCVHHRLCRTELVLVISCWRPVTRQGIGLLNPRFNPLSQSISTALKKKLLRQAINFHHFPPMNILHKQSDSFNIADALKEKPTTCSQTLCLSLSRRIRYLYQPQHSDTSAVIQPAPVQQQSGAFSNIGNTVCHMLMSR